VVFFTAATDDQNASSSVTPGGFAMPGNAGEPALVFVW
jgi:hypothetical protein